MSEDVRRQLPSVQRLLSQLGGEAGPRWALREAARAIIEERRAVLLRGGGLVEITPAEVWARAGALCAPSLRPVVNATGVVLHTNLGRSPLSEAAIARVVEVARGYSNLELELTTGERGSRHDHVGALLAGRAGAEAAAVVNNGAAAILLALSALAAGRAVLVSRGELVEIGGSFRVPDILALSGARMIEVGTTNRTHLRDYANAMTPEVGVILKVHRSNFALVGFTAEPARAELVGLARQHGALVVEDLGSGCLLDESYGGHREPSLREVVAAGVDLVTASGDKLLGGPQAGLIAGRAALVARVKKHPLARAVRVDKMTLAALEATLAAYRDDGGDSLPMLSMLRATRAALWERAEALAAQLRGAVSRGTFTVEPVIERVGGGALPLGDLEGAAVSCVIVGHKAARVEEWLRRGSPPVVARIERDKVWLHPRTLRPGDEASIVARLAALEVSR